MTQQDAVACHEPGTSTTDCPPLTEIQSFYKGSRIFITGVTGFLGHVLLAKLLTSCPGIEKIYVLIRSKKGQCAAERFKKMMDNKIFDTAKKACPNYSTLLRVIPGDCLEEGLGINEADREELRAEVSVVFHVAATVNFDAPIREAARMNIRSTDYLIELAKTMDNLQSFVHVSTAFSNCVGRVDIAEKYYDPPMSPDNLLTLVENLDEDTLQSITPTLLGDYPNTYIFTKAVAEDVCRQKGCDLPLAVFRPSIVISTAKEPVKGFISNVYGPTGIVAAAAVGLLHTLQCDEECIADIVPCEYVTNGIIAVAKTTSDNWKVRGTTMHETEEKDVNENASPQSIYNFASSSTKNKIKWKEYMEYNSRYEFEISFDQAIWVYFLMLTKSKFLYTITAFFFHTIPAFIIDNLSKLSGKKPEMMRAYQRLNKLTEVISYFNHRQWNIKNKHVESLWQYLSDEDKRIFYFNLNDIDWPTYMRDHLHGIKWYILKDSPHNIQAAANKRIKLKIAHYSLISLFFGLVSYISFVTLRWMLSHMINV